MTSTTGPYSGSVSELHFGVERTFGILTFPVRLIDARGRFIGHEQGRARKHGAHDGHTLALATTQPTISPRSNLMSTASTARARLCPSS